MKDLSSNLLESQVLQRFSRSKNMEYGSGAVLYTDVQEQMSL